MEQIRFSGNYKNAPAEFEGNKWQTAKMRPPRPADNAVKNEPRKKRYSAYDIVLHPENTESKAYLTTKDGIFRTFYDENTKRSKWRNEEGILGAETDVCNACFTGIDDACKLLNKLIA